MKLELTKPQLFLLEKAIVAEMEKVYDSTFCSGVGSPGNDPLCSLVEYRNLFLVLRQVQEVM